MVVLPLSETVGCRGHETTVRPRPLRSLDVPPSGPVGGRRDPEGPPLIRQVLLGPSRRPVFLDDQP